MTHLSYNQYLALIDLRLKGEMMLKRWEVVPTPNPLLFMRYDYLKLFNEIVDGLLHQYRNRKSTL